MTVHVMTEGQADARLLLGLLRDFDDAALRVSSVGGRSMAESMAEKVLITTGEPVVLVVDADGTDPDEVAEDKASVESFLRPAAGPVPFEVVLVVPEMEALLFEAPSMLKRLFGVADLPRMRTKRPKAVLRSLDGSPTLADVMAKLGADDWQALRETPTGRRIRAAVREVARRVPRVV
jgi:hypothetical protein